MIEIEFTQSKIEYNSKYPEGIPTSMELRIISEKILDSRLVIFPCALGRFKIICAKEVLNHMLI